MKSVLALFGLAAVLAAMLAWEIAAPGAETGSSAPGAEAGLSAALASAGAASRGVPDADALSGIVGAIDERPLFNRDRRASNKLAGKLSGGTAIDASLPRLAGVIIGPSGGRAIFALADGKSRSAAVGEAVGRFTVTDIATNAVTLSSAGGELRLRPTYAPSPADSPAGSSTGRPTGSPTGSLGANANAPSQTNRQTR
jgi:hypothetical protein